jgi:ABC-2 type transport system permease protein
MGKTIGRTKVLPEETEVAMAKLLLYELRARRWAIIGWGLALAVFAGYIIILFEEFSEQLAGFNIDDIAIYQVMGDFGDFTSFAGFVSAEVFVFLPVLLAVYAIVNGSGTLGGEEDSGRLEPIMALPLARWKLVVTKFLALAITILVILIIVVLAMVVAFNSLPESVDTGTVTTGGLALAAFAVWPLIMFFGTLSLFLGAYFPTRRAAAVTATVVLLIGYFGNNLVDLVDFLEDIHFLLPFKYYNGRDTLLNGLNNGDLLIMLGAVAAFLVLAILAFQRRNVTVGDWPWQRPRIPEPEDKPVEIAPGAATD